MNLNKTDLVILSSLLRNPDLSFSKIAEKVNLSDVSVRSHIKKMESQDLFKKTILLNLTSFSFTLVIVHFKMDNFSQKQKFIDFSKKCPRISFLFQTFHELNLCAILAVEDRSVVSSLRNGSYCLIQSQEFQNLEIYQVDECVNQTFFPLSFPVITDQSSSTPCNKNCLKCEKYTTRVCLGCPALPIYRGSLQIKPENSSISDS